MDIILPINVDIPYGGMMRERNRLSAIMAYQENVDWYFNNFVSVMMYDNGNIHCYDTTNSYEIFDMYDQVMDLKIIHVNEYSINGLVNILMSQQYILAYGNQFYIPGCKGYQKENKYIEILIYGYETSQNRFLFHASGLYGKDYCTGAIPSDCLLHAIENSLDAVKQTESPPWQFCFGHPVSKFFVKKVKQAVNYRKLYFQYQGLLQGKRITVTIGHHNSYYDVGINVFDGINRLCESIKADDKKVSLAVWSIKVFSHYLQKHAACFYYLNTLTNIENNDMICKAWEDCSVQTMRLYMAMKKYEMFRKDKDIVQVLRSIPIIRGQFQKAVEYSVSALYNIIQKGIDG